MSNERAAALAYDMRGAHSSLMRLRGSCCVLVVASTLLSTPPASATPPACTTLDRCVTTLALGQSPAGVATDGTRVYWADRARNAIVSAPVSGGASTVLLDGQASPTLDGINAEDIFWHTPGALQRASKNNGAAVTLQTGTIIAATVSEQWIAWVGRRPGGGVFWAPTNTTQGRWRPQMVHGDGDEWGAPRALAIDGTSLYSASTEGVARFVDGAGYRELAGGDPIRASFALAADASFIFIRAQHSLFKVSTTDGSTTCLANQQDDSGKAILDGATLYWTNPTTGTVNSTSKYGGAITTLVTGKIGAMDLAVDATSIYFTTPSAIVRVTPK